MRLVAVRGHDVPFAHRRDLGQRRTRMGWREAARRCTRTAIAVRAMNKAIAMAAACVLAACATSTMAQTPQRIGDAAPPVRQTILPTSASQGAMIVGTTHGAATVSLDGRQLRVSPAGVFVFGIGRDARGEAVVSIKQPGTGVILHRIAITPRDWPIERIDGVPPATVNPPPAIAARIEREQAQVVAARVRDDDRIDFAQTFTWPLQGRISGRFGNQRIYMLPDGSGTPKSAHSGMDIAAPNGTPVKAPA